MILNPQWHRELYHYKKKRVENKICREQNLHYVCQQNLWTQVSDGNSYQLDSWFNLRVSPRVSLAPKQKWHFVIKGNSKINVILWKERLNSTIALIKFQSIHLQSQHPSKILGWLKPIRLENTSTSSMCCYIVRIVDMKPIRRCIYMKVKLCHAKILR